MLQEFLKYHSHTHTSPFEDVPSTRLESKSSRSVLICSSNYKHMCGSFFFFLFCRACFSRQDGKSCAQFAKLAQTSLWKCAKALTDILSKANKIAKGHCSLGLLKSHRKGILRVRYKLNLYTGCLIFSFLHWFLAKQIYVVSSWQTHLATVIFPALMFSLHFQLCGFCSIN